VEEFDYDEAFTAASASATDVWQVENNQNFVSEAISPTAIAITGGKLKGDGIAITCFALTINGGVITTGSGGSATSVALSGCVETVDQAECVLESSTITTAAITLGIVGTEEVEFRPAIGTEFVTLKLNNVTRQSMPNQR
jgi:hypothetical protein